MKLGFVARGFLLATVVVLAATAAVLVFTQPGRRLLFPPDVPPPPVIAASRGTLPAAPVGLVERALYQGSEYWPVGRGFLFRLLNGTPVGVTTAHSVSWGQLTNIALAQHEQSDTVASFHTLQGRPGVPRGGEDMTVDYVLLKTPATAVIDPAFILEPDPRPLAQPGERVSLYTVLNDQPRIFEGAVLTADPTAIWVVMDEVFDPSGLSGSPFLSQYTGKVIGMAIATTRRGGKVLLGLHPIGSLLEKAQAATEFSEMADYR